MFTPINRPPIVDRAPCKRLKPSRSDSDSSHAVAHFSSIPLSENPISTKVPSNEVADGKLNPGAPPSGGSPTSPLSREPNIKPSNNPSTSITKSTNAHRSVYGLVEPYDTAVTSTGLNNTMLNERLNIGESTHAKVGLRVTKPDAHLHQPEGLTYLYKPWAPSCGVLARTTMDRLQPLLHAPHPRKSPNSHTDEANDLKLASNIPDRPFSISSSDQEFTSGLKVLPDDNRDYSGSSAPCPNNGDFSNNLRVAQCAHVTATDGLITNASMLDDSQSSSPTYDDIDESELLKLDWDPATRSENNDFDDIDEDDLLGLDGHDAATIPSKHIERKERLSSSHFSLSLPSSLYSSSVTIQRSSDSTLPEDAGVLPAQQTANAISNSSQHLPPLILDDEFPIDEEEEQALQKFSDSVADDENEPDECVSTSVMTDESTHGQRSELLRSEKATVLSLPDHTVRRCTDQGARFKTGSSDSSHVDTRKKFTPLIPKLSSSSQCKPLAVFARPEFPASIRDRSPVLGLTSSTVLRTCFRIGEAYRIGCSANNEQEMIVELFARVSSSFRESSTQVFELLDLFHDKQPHLRAVLDNYKTSTSVDQQSSAFLESDIKMARCLGLVKKGQVQGWVFNLINIRLADWAEVQWTKMIISSN